MLGHVIENTKLHLAEAIQVYETMYQETGKTSAVLMKILPLLADPEEARKLLLRVTKGDRLHMNRLKQAMGSTLKGLR
jgi:hypothetical protein